MQPKIIGLTGPIASGKSEVAKILKRLGCCVIDADEIGHSLLTPQSDTWKQLVKAFGARILHPGGRVNRKKLAELVFADRKLLRKLNSIMHPEMRKEIEKELRAQSTEHRTLIVVNAAVLKEMGLIPLVDEVWAVIADKKKRMERLVKKGMGRDAALMRINSQMGDGDYKKMADVVIRNDSTPAALRAKVLSIYNV